LAFSRAGALVQFARMPSPTAPDTVMLDYGYWQRRFQWRQVHHGRAIAINGKQHQ